MKTKILMTMMMSLAASAQAGYRFPMERTARVCIERSTFTTEEMFGLVEADSHAFTEKLCAKNGGLPQLHSVTIKNLDHGCPYGHQFEYIYSGTCVIP